MPVLPSQRGTDPRVARWIAFGFVALLLCGVAGGAAASGGNLAPTFTLPDIYGQNFSLESYRGHAVVLIEFTSLSCSECQIVEQSLKSLYAQYNASGKSDVVMLSVFVEPQYGDTIPALRAYQQKNDVTWYMAQDTDSLAVYRAYGVSDIPTIVIVDTQGHAIYDNSGAQTTAQLQSAIQSGLTGTASTISIVAVSAVALAALAGVTTFFSPCAFPMFPGYMAVFLGLNTPAAASGGTKTAYKGAVRRALSAGSISALGMMVVFLVIGVALVLAASVVGGYIPYFLVVVGAVLIGLGALLLTNLQYWRIVTPLQRAWGRISGRSGANAPILPTETGGRGFYLKLFGYGMGYAAAAAGCVAPVILSAVVAGLALGWLGGVVNILIFSLTAAFLMIAVTLFIALAGQRYVNQLKALTPIIKKISAVALLIVGVYLVYFYYTAWVL
jgi:cytochrome c-type biogenesis protein